ncbi:MAG TPA: hypothetical protein VFY73_12785 [Ideonella sp.]|uniref:hypothetical protein n=1 Tax=Ideonella sp. TaxID=1929293 RepID=UPI002E33F338|nr:hypothetical protein [Ideonella sp.]HEX5684894.1 hypothetical protein [Ideonella sp.]
MLQDFDHRELPRALEYLRDRSRSAEASLADLTGADITLKDGIVEPRNLNDFVVPWISHVPQIAVHNEPVLQSVPRPSAGCPIWAVRRGGGEPPDADHDGAGGRLDGRPV